MESRVIKLKTLRNFRTLGGLKGAEGKIIREGMLFRSAMLNQLSPNDSKVLTKQLNLTEIIDLRTEYERECNPDLVPENVRCVYLPIARTNIPGVSREALPGQNITPEMLPDLKEMYAELLKNQEFLTAFGLVLKEIMRQRDGAVLWHCTAGKDRCGLVTVFILYILGVSQTDIQKDYLLTNRDTWRDAIKYFTLVLLMKRNLTLARRVYGAYIASPKYLRAAKRVIEASYGTIDRFIEHGLEVTDEEIRSFREYALK